MGGLYLTGAFLYAARIPERWLPGKCDIWFQSHQLFHVLVVAAAFVHYHGISEMAMRRLKDLGPQCPTLSVTLDSENLVNIVQKKTVIKFLHYLKNFREISRAFQGSFYSYSLFGIHGEFLGRLQQLLKFLLISLKFFNMHACKNKTPAIAFRILLFVVFIYLIHNLNQQRLPTQAR